MTQWLLRIYVALAVFQPYRDLEAGDNQSLKFKWRGGKSNPGPRAPQTKSLTTRPPPLPGYSKRIESINIYFIVLAAFCYNIIQASFLSIFDYSPSHIVQITDFLEFLHEYCKENLKRVRNFKLVLS